MFEIKYLLQTRIFTALPRRNAMYIYFIYLATPYLSWYSSVTKWSITPITLISKNNKARILNTLFKVKLVVLVEQLVPLLRRNFPYAFLSGVISRQLLFRVSVRSRFLKNYTAKVFYQILKVPKVAIVKNYFEKFNKFHMAAPWVSHSLVKL